MWRFGDGCEDIVDQNLAVVHNNCVGLSDLAVRFTIDEKLIAVNENIGIKAGGETVEWFVACALENLSGRHACLVAIGDDDDVAAHLFLDTAKQNIV